MDNRRFWKQITLLLWNVRCVKIFYRNKKYSLFILAPPSPIFFLEENHFPWMSHLGLENVYSLYLVIHCRISAHVLDSHPSSVHLWRGSASVFSVSSGQVRKFTWDVSSSGWKGTTSSSCNYPDKWMAQKIKKMNHSKNSSEL